MAVGEKYFPLIGTACGVCFGWMLSQLSQWRNKINEEARTRKEVVFYLLDLRHLLASLNIKAIKEVLLKTLRLRLPAHLITDDFDQQAGPYFSLMIGQMIKPLFEQRFPAIKEGFNRAVTKLSSVDPLLAFDLSGKEDTIKFGEIINTLLLNSGYAETSDGDKKLRQKISSVLEDEFVIQSKASIDTLLLRISWKTGMILWYKVRRAIRRMDNRFEEGHPELARFLDNYFTQLESPG